MIWIVSDNHRTREVLAPLVVAKGYQVAEMDCGDEVLKRIRFQTPLLLVIDCALPDGFDLIAKVRAEPRGRSIPVIMYTTASEDLREKALLKGADAYVPKGSMDWVELLAEVRRFAGPPRGGEKN